MQRPGYAPVSKKTNRGLIFFQDNGFLQAATFRNQKASPKWIVGLDKFFKYKRVSI
jgi:hypothetical protein